MFSYREARWGVKAPRLGAAKPGRCWEPGTSTAEREQSGRRKDLVGFRGGATPESSPLKLHAPSIAAGVCKCQSSATVIYN